MQLLLRGRSREADVERRRFEGAPVALYRTGPGGELLDANRALLRMLGYPDLKTWRSRDAGSLWTTPEERVRWQTQLDREGVIRDFETLYRTYDGRMVRVRDSARAVVDADGRVLCYDGMLRKADAPAGSEAPDELQVVPDIYRQIVEEIDTDIAVFDRELRYEYVNPVAVKDPAIRRWMIGKTDEEYCVYRGKPLRLAEERQRHMRRAVETARVVAFEESFTTPAGETRHFLRKFYPVTDHGGSVVRLLGYGFDLTDRKRAEEALRASETRYRLLFEEGLSGNYVSTADGTIAACNEAFLDMFGYRDLDEALRLGVRPLYPRAADRDAFLERLRVDGLIENQESQLARLDGTPIQVIENATGLFDEAGDLVEIHGVVIDISQRKRLEEQLHQAQKMEAVGLLAGGVAHDFNNTLTIIQGISDLLLEETVDENTANDVREIKRAAEHATSLTRQLLAFSRRQMLRPQVVDLNEVVEGMSGMLRSLLADRIQLSLSLETEPSGIYADRSQLEQVLMNLAVNAGHAIEGSGRVGIATRRVVLDAAEADRLREHEPDAVPGAYVRLEVVDDGEGMDAETRKRIFEPFFTTRPPDRGTGLGLSTVYGIVKQSGGFLTVRSQPGVGTEFHVYLPRISAPRPQTPEEPPQEPLRSRSTILLAEDQPDVRRLARRVLEGEGYIILSAGDGEEALRVAEQQKGPIDLLLTDLVMPRMSGGELARRMRELRPGIAVLYMSGHTDDELVRSGITRGEAEFLPKPFAAGALAETVRQVLARAAADRAR